MNRTSRLLALLVVAATTPVAAQIAAPLRVNWFLKDLRTGMCVQFLVSPAAAQAEMPQQTPVAIESVADRYPVLARVAAAESAYAGWVPAQYCWFLYRSAVVAGKIVEVAGGRQPVMVGYFALEALSLPDSATAVAVGLFTNSGTLARIVTEARLQIDKIDFTIGFIPEEENSTTRSRYVAGHGRATVQWDGGPGDPRPPQASQIRLVGYTNTRGLRGIHSDLTPDSVFVASGNLSVVGRGALKGMLSASPIRLVTPYLRGGDSDWQLGRQ